MENYKKIASLITKSRKEPLTEQEQSLLNDWLNESEQNKQLFKRLSDEAYLRRLSTIDLKADRKEAIRLYRNKLQEEGRGWERYYGKPMYAALTMVGLIVAGFFFYFNKNWDNKEIALTKVTPKPTTPQAPAPASLDSYLPGQSKAMLTFKDGSNVLLDTVPIGRSIASNDTFDVVKEDSGHLVVSRFTGKKKGKKIGSNADIRISTPRGGQYRLTLIDGSTIQLNALSAIQFPVSFSEGERTVSLSGEAYFGVSEQMSADNHTKKPFVVNVNQTQVYVMGTEFNIMAYDDEPVMKTTLLSGVVRLSKEGVNKIITAGEQAQVDKNGGFLILDKTKTDISEAIAWKSKKIRLRDAPLTEVLHQISRLYGVEISLDRSVVFDKHINVVIASENKPLPKALEVVKKLSEVNYKYENGVIYFAQ